jgi:hypothetical protein
MLNACFLNPIFDHLSMSIHFTCEDDFGIALFSLQELDGVRLDDNEVLQLSQGPSY